MSAKEGGMGNFGVIFTHLFMYIISEHGRKPVCANAPTAPAPISLAPYVDFCT